MFYKRPLRGFCKRWYRVRMARQGLKLLYLIKQLRCLTDQQRRLICICGCNVKMCVQRRCVQCRWWGQTSSCWPLRRGCSSRRGLGRAVTDLVVPYMLDRCAAGMERRPRTRATLATHAAMALGRVEARPKAPFSARAGSAVRAKRCVLDATLAAVVVPLYRVSAFAMVLASGEAQAGW
jgi:hypothetical protein